MPNRPFVLIWRKAKDPSKKKHNPKTKKKSLKKLRRNGTPQNSKTSRSSANLKSKSRSLSLSLPPFLRLKSQTLAVAVDERSTRRGGGEAAASAGGGGGGAPP